MVYARGGAYGSEQAKGMDLQKGYMDLLLGFIGFTEVHSILVEPTLAAAEEVDQTVAQATAQAREVAQNL